MTSIDWSRFPATSGSRHDLGQCDFRLEEGGSLAVYGERPKVSTGNDSLPWFVFHGGPGGRINSSLIGPLRKLGLGWFGFDQRNSGLSDDLRLEDLDLQRMVDDAMAVADHLGCGSFNILAGSWGATIALALASQQPDRVAYSVLRAPFIPFRSRLDHFFRLLEEAGPELFACYLGAGWRTAEVTSYILVPDSREQLTTACLCWSILEECLLGIRSEVPKNLNDTVSKLSAKDIEKLWRKYQLQCHFLAHDCFWPEPAWQKDMQKLASSGVKIAICQGTKDTVCPPDGALLIKDLIPKTKLGLIQNCGHLAGSSLMDNALEAAISDYVS